MKPRVVRALVESDCFLPPHEAFHTRLVDSCSSKLRGRCIQRFSYGPVFCNYRVCKGYISIPHYGICTVDCKFILGAQGFEFSEDGSRRCLKQWGEPARLAKDECVKMFSTDIYQHPPIYLYQALWSLFSGI